MKASNPPKSKRPSRRPASRKARPRHLLLDVEALEPRFLLSTAAEILTTGSPIVSSVGPAPVSLATDPAGTQVDAYTLPAGSGYPAIRVELAWLPGNDPAVGSLRVLDASGNLLYDLPLEGVTSLRAVLDVPSGSTSSPLEVDLTIQPDDPDLGDGGSYRLDVSWLKNTLATTNSALPSSSGAAPSTVLGLGVNPPATVSSQGVVLPPPSLHTGGLLPTFPIAGIPPVTGESSTGSPSGTTPNMPPAGSATSTPPSSGTGYSGVDPFISPGRMTPTPNPSTPGGSTSSGPSTLADQGRPTFLGPLPIGPSTADGGLFGRQSIPVEALPVEETSGFETSVVIQGAAATAGLVGKTGPIPRRGSGSNRPTGPRWPRQPFLDLFGDEDTAVPTTEGPAFLPPIVAMISARIEAKPAGETRKRRPARSQENVVASVLLVMTGSVLLLLGLNAPERLAALAAWREERRTRKSA